MTMRKLLVLALLLAGSGVAWADSIPTVVNETSRSPVWTVTVFNDSGATLTSGDVVVWDQADADFTSEGNPYVITSTTADDPWTAGVMQTASCPDQSLCEIIVYGIAEHVLIDDATDAAPVDTAVGISPTNAGNVSSYASGADTCMLGIVLDMEATDGVDNAPARVFVNVSCD